jgi:prevent-host-death family protein
VSAINPSEDIRSVTELKRNTREILDHLKTSGRPVILTVNGRADSVLLDVRVYEQQLRAANLARFLAPAEADASEGRTRPAREFLKDLKRATKVSR